MRRDCQLTAEAASQRVSAGGSVTVSGKLSCTGGSNPTGQTISVYRHQRLAGLVLVGTVTSAEDGSYEFTSAAIDVNSIFVVRAASAHGARAAVKVAPNITLEEASPGAQTSAVSGHRPPVRAKALFTGKVSPFDEGAAVTLQVSYAASGERWRSVAFGHVGADGSYSIAHAFRIPGTLSVRTIARAGKLNTAAISEPLTYIVAPPQNPELTIQTSADPIVYGQSVTITGVAANAAEQPVSLLARTHGQRSFAVVATSTTDAAGNYTFAQTPTQSTYYIVSDAKTQSTSLLEGVTFALTPALATSPSGTAQLGQQATFSGTIAPAHAGQTVYLEREYASGVGFHVIGTGTVDSASTYAISYTFGALGTGVMRIRVPGSPETLGATSEAFTTTVAR